MTDAALPVRTGTLWFALLGGPAAWTIHLLASYPLVPLACSLQTTTPLNLVTAGTALLALAAGLTGWRAWRRLRSDRTAEGGTNTADDDILDARGRARFMAVAGSILAVFFTYVIVVEGLPPLLQDPCIDGL